MTQHQGIGAYFSYFNLAYTKNMSALSAKTFNLFLHKKGDALPDLVSLTTDKAKRYQVQFKKERGNDVNIMVANHTGSIEPAVNNMGQRGQGVLDFVLFPNTTYEVYISTDTEVSEVIGEITTITKVTDAPNILSTEGVEKIDTAVPEGVDLFPVGNYQLLFPVLLREAPEANVEWNTVVPLENIDSTNKSLYATCAVLICAVDNGKSISIFTSPDELLFYLFTHHTAETTEFSQKSMETSTNLRTTFLLIKIR